jgi:hypothetical protein
MGKFDNGESALCDDLKFDEGKMENNGKNSKVEKHARR